MYASPDALPTQPPPGEPPGPDETLDRLLGDWWIFQLARGHRFSTDDLLTGWRAAQAVPQARRCLDLGCGIGSVGLYTLGVLGHADATLVGIEAQDVSIGLARRSVARNGLQARVTLLHGDLRDAAVLPEALRPVGGFDLVTGSPPYIPLGKGLVSPHPQRAACRMELRGSVFDYAATAAPLLAPHGRFVFVMSARDPRTEAAPVEAGLVVVHRLDVVFREGETPMIAVLTCARADAPDRAPRVDETLLVREASGAFSPAYAALRAGLGFRR
ncbi:MAG: methyltransferase [Alphaproteobacteria bacterium]|nr:methyltransferase [Alphaproteobacteria bacterium]